MQPAAICVSKIGEITRAVHIQIERLEILASGMDDFPRSRAR